jgi:acyl-CoA thioester hydrolase
MTATAQTAAAKPAGGVLIPLSVHFDDLDAMGMLHNSHYQVLVERAWVAFWQGHGLINAGRPSGDSFNVVKAFSVNHELPVLMPGEYAVHLWTQHVGTTSVTAGFRVCSADGATTYAHGTRTAVRIDDTTLRPTPWSAEVRVLAESIALPPT